MQNTHGQLRFTLPASVDKGLFNFDSGNFLMKLNSLVVLDGPCDDDYDDWHRNPNINIREIIWFGNQLVGFRPGSSFPEAPKQTKLKVAKTEQFGISNEPLQTKTNKHTNKETKKQTKSKITKTKQLGILHETNKLQTNIKLKVSKTEQFRIF